MQPVADLLQRARLVVFEAETQPHDLALLAVEITEGGLEPGEIGPMNHLVLDRRDAVLLDEVAELGGGATVTGIRGAADPDRLAQRDVRAAARPAAQREKELRRERERARLIGEDVHHRLAHPPDRVRDELHVVRRIEPVRRFDEPEVAFVNQVEEGDAEPPVPLGEGDDEPQVGFDQARDRCFVAVVVDAMRERALLVDGQPRQLRDLAQVSRQRARVGVERPMPSRHAMSILRSG